jgi:putative ABC transport system ATP-binding protein
MHEPVASQTLTAAVSAVGAVKTYGRGDTEVRALDRVDVQFERGRLSAIMGPSGSGKSTLLHCLAGLDQLSAGHVFLGPLEISSMSETHLTQVRRDRLGFVFQSYNLIPTLNAYENIVLPTALAGREPDHEWVNRVIDVVGLANRLTHRPSELSGGQQQRVAVARALANHPEVVFADEPTGNLDSRSRGDILRFMRLAVDEFAQTIVMVTHDPVAAAIADRVVFVSDGKIVAEELNPTAESLSHRMARIES